ncbi:hypothetical protein GCM10011519_04000 [Marmoricola endophyticus]|uniref:Actinobacteria/chloroflexi VLRF1 release factor domain-containing protein n=1 Tax=Marmoricola endophyticus TaxID=2040280 RepID=A0A917F1L3_9ACTN|nr:acVLRF1 family peptidyl-tRNA hydrolase [Marmoricola endophyticus]GGF33750.1 hypothetical protein GCM10011519_04000 [Marmoricola endophyticus]
MADLLVPPVRLPRWAENFESRHGPTSLRVADGALQGTAEDGASYAWRLPFGRGYDGPPDRDGFLSGVLPPDHWGVLLVRRGGFAVARLRGAEVTDSKVGRRHVQGRTKAGGQSQQRFARRRANQAREAFEAAAGHAARVLGDRPLTALVTGGDREAVDAVLVSLPAHVVVPPWLAVPDPRRDVLERSVRDACAVRVVVDNAEVAS